MPLLLRSEIPLPKNPGERGADAVVDRLKRTVEAEIAENAPFFRRIVRRFLLHDCKKASGDGLI